MKLKVNPILPVVTLSLILASCGQNQTPKASAAPQTAAAPGQTTLSAQAISRAVTTTAPGPDISKLPSQARLGETIIRPGNRLNSQALGTSAQTNKVALRVLILSTGAGDVSLASAQAMLQQAGVPYDVLDATTTPLSAESLIDSSGVGRYQGIILTTSALSVQDSSGNFVSALDSNEWNTLFQYEAAYQVRQLALYGYPGALPEDYGLRPVSGAETSTTSMNISSAGKAVFSDLTGNAIPVNYSYTYPSTLQSVTGVTTQPLLTDASGRILAVTSTSADHRERLLLTTAQNPNLLHTELLGYGLVQWLTRGVHLGAHNRFLKVDIDDWFNSGDHLDANLQLTPTPFRPSSTDALSLVDQQNRLRWNYPVASNFKYSLAFNGTYADMQAWNTCLPVSGLTGDPLTSVTRCLSGQFDWVNHTKSHYRMDVMDYATALDEIKGNFTIGSKLGLAVNTRSLVTGENSGLGFMDPADDGTRNADDTLGPKQDLGLGRSNVNMLSAAAASGVQYLASNHSVPSQWDPSCVTCGLVHPLNSAIFLVPRWPVNVAYYVTAPAEQTAWYNSIYGPTGKLPFWDHNLSYSEILDKESDLALNHVLAGAAFPHYMHIQNLNQYASGQSLATDWIKALLTKYSKYSTLPLGTPSWDKLGSYLAAHTAEEKAKAAGTLSGVWDRTARTVTLTSTAGPVTETLTGATNGTSYSAYRIQTGTVAGSLTVGVTAK